MENPTTLILLAGAAIAAYMLWPLIKGAGSAVAALTTGVSSATNAVSSGIADAYVSATSGPAITAGGSVVLSTGQEVPISALQNVKPLTLPDGTASATFSYGGHAWQFTGPSDDTGTYYAYMVS